MQINNWQVWLSYVANMSGDLDLGDLSRRLVDDDVCAVTYLPTGSRATFKNEKRKTISTSLNLAKEPYSASGSFELPPELLEQTFAAECVTLAAHMDVHEHHLRAELPHEEFVRGYLGEHRLRFGDHFALVYPNFKLYANGTVMTHLRILSPEDGVSAEYLVDHAINLAMAVADDVYLNATACRAYLASFFQKANWWTRRRPFGRDKWLQRTTALLKSIQFEDSSGDFPACFVSVKTLLDRLEVSDAGLLDLRGLANHIHSMIFDSVVETTRSARFAPSWFAMPTVHLIGFSDQPKYAEDYSEEQLETFANISSRSAVPLGFGKEVLGSDLRPHNDYSMYLSKSAILFVLGSNHVETMLNDSPNAIDSGQRDWAIYDKQVIAELVLLLKGTLHRWDDLSQTVIRGNASVRRCQMEVVNYERTLVDVSNFDEINELLRQAVVTLGLAKHAERVRENFQLTAVEAAEQQEQLTRKFGWSLTVLLGLLGVPALSDGFVEPLWEMAGWWRPELSSVADVFFFATSTALLLTILLLTWRTLKWRWDSVRRRRK